MYPTTIAQGGGEQVAVNSQFDARETGNPELPFNVSGIDVPEAAGSSGMPETGGPNPLLLLGGAVAALVVAIGALALILRTVLRR